MTYSSDHHNQSIRLKLCNTEAGFASVFLKSTNLLERVPYTNAKIRKILELSTFMRAYFSLSLGSKWAIFMK